jgi:predicted transposase YbfD/YdcC
VNVRGKVVIGDALHTQRATSMLVGEEQEYYLWIAKENQSALKAEIAHLFAPQQCPPATSSLPTDFRSVTRYSYGHGRFETRTLTASAMLKDYLDWPYLEQVFKLDVEQHHLTSGKRSCETYYGLTSLPPAKASPDRLLALKRHYWRIENRLHYRRGVSLNEDRCRLRRGHAAQLMALINNLVLALIDRLDFPTVPDARCRFSAKPLEALNLIFHNPVTTLQ